jgi:hypothetical protein
MTGQPWDFATALAASHAAETEQRRVESEVTTAYREFARAEELYEVALARRIWQLKAEGVAITACKTLAEGEPSIAVLKRERNEKEGLKETSKLAGWRVNADRRDVEGFIDWSKRRDLAEGYHRVPEPVFSSPIGAGS